MLENIDPSEYPRKIEMPRKTYFILHYPAKTNVGAGKNCWVKSFDEANRDLKVTNVPDQALKFEKKENATLLNATLKRNGVEGGIVQSQYLSAAQAKAGMWTFENPKPAEEVEEPNLAGSTVETVEPLVNSPSSGTETTSDTSATDATSGDIRYGHLTQENEAG